MGKQKTASAGAPRDKSGTWGKVDWQKARREVRRLQIRIAKAVLENRWNKVKTLQHLLTRSFHAKLLAVKRVTSNKKTADYYQSSARASPPLAKGDLGGFAFDCR